MSDKRAAAEVVRAALGLAEDMVAGKVQPEDLHPKAVAMAREVVGLVIGPQDPMWVLQCDIARQVIALGGIPANELGEWTAVFRQAEERQQSWVERVLASDDDADFAIDT